MSELAHVLMLPAGFSKSYQVNERDSRLSASRVYSTILDSRVQARGITGLLRSMVVQPVMPIEGLRVVTR